MASSAAASDMDSGSETTFKDDDDDTMEMLSANLPTNMFRTPDPRLQRACQEAERTNQLMPVLKEELRLRILAKRMEKGEPEIDTLPETPKTYELTEEEMRKRERRKEQNRRAAKKCRERRKMKTMSIAEKMETFKGNIAQMRNDVALLRHKKEVLTKFCMEHIACGNCPYVQSEVANREVMAEYLEQMTSCASPVTSEMSSVASSDSNTNPRSVGCDEASCSTDEIDADAAMHTTDSLHNFVDDPRLALLKRGEIVQYEHDTDTSMSYTSVKPSEINMAVKSPNILSRIMSTPKVYPQVSIEPNVELISKPIMAVNQSRVATQSTAHQAARHARRSSLPSTAHWNAIYDHSVRTTGSVHSTIQDSPSDSSPEMNPFEENGNKKELAFYNEDGSPNGSTNLEQPDSQSLNHSRCSDLTTLSSESVVQKIAQYLMAYQDSGHSSTLNSAHEPLCIDVTNSGHSPASVTVNLNDAPNFNASHHYKHFLQQTINGTATYSAVLPALDILPQVLFSSPTPKPKCTISSNPLGIGGLTHFLHSGQIMTHISPVHSASPPSPNVTHKDTTVITPNILNSNTGSVIHFGKLCDSIRNSTPKTHNHYVLGRSTSSSTASSHGSVSSFNLSPSPSEQSSSSNNTFSSGSTHKGGSSYLPQISPVSSLSDNSPQMRFADHPEEDMTD